MRPLLAATAAAALTLSTACHATQLAAVWREPAAQPLRFHKTVTVFVAKDEALRRSIEDKIAERFVFLNGVPSYRVVPLAPESTDGADRTAILRTLRDSGFDGAIIMRVTQITQEPVYTPGTYWYGTPNGFAGYWSASWAYPYDPGAYYSDQIVTVETQIYSLKDDKLIFAARSETTNPSSAGHLADSVMRHVLSELRKQGLLAS